MHGPDRVLGIYINIDYLMRPVLTKGGGSLIGFGGGGQFSVNLEGSGGMLLQKSQTPSTPPPPGYGPVNILDIFEVQVFEVQVSRELESLG